MSGNLPGDSARIPFPTTRAESEHLKRQIEKVIDTLGEADQINRARFSNNEERKKLIEEALKHDAEIQRLKNDTRVYTATDPEIIDLLRRAKSIKAREEDLCRQTHELCDFASPFRAAGYAIEIEKHGYPVFRYLSQQERKQIAEYHEFARAARDADEAVNGADWDASRIEVFSKSIAGWGNYLIVFRACLQDLLADVVRHIGSLESVQAFHALPGNSQPVLQQDKKTLAHPDGPHPPNCIRFNTKTVELEPIPWRLAEYMWSRDSALISDVCEYVWGEKSDAVSDSRINSARSKVNEALLKLGVTWSLGRKSGHIRKM